MRLDLCLFGQFHASWDGQPITFASSSARAVLAYLALEPDQPHQRERLAALLWPDLPQAAAYANLRQALASVRKTLRHLQDVQAFLEITPHTLRFKRAAATTDVTRFEELLGACAAHAHLDMAGCAACAERLTEATSLYRGELLQGLFLAQPFEEWLLLKREQLHQQALTALGSLANHHLVVGRLAEASDAARRQIALSPWHEAAHRQLMRALAQAGDRAAALVAFERCRQMLQDELGVEPDTETLALAAQIRAAEATLHAPSPTLPTPLTPLFGRENELARIDALLRARDTRLVTIVGVGGAGKTRLALAAAWALRATFADGVGWVPLASIAPSADLALQADALAIAVGAALGLPFDGRRVPFGELCRILRECALLLVLDNCEHLPVATFVHALLAAAPQLRVLTTSRTQLDITGEVLVRLEGLPVPQAHANDPARYAGVQLFLERAQRHVPDVGRTPADIASVVRLCQLLDGLPLGIELAARWVGHYTCDEIATELEADLDFLAVESSDRPERHHSLRAAFDYSWAMLREPERQALARLSIFRGTFDRAAAQAVAAIRVTTLAALVDASLLRHLGVGRYGFHELVRQFAAVRSADRGEAEALAERHAAYYLDLLAQQEPRLYGDTAQVATTVIRDATDNLRQAWSWAVAHSAWDGIARSLPALRQYVRIDSLFYENTARVAAAAERLGAQLAQGETAPDDAVLLGRLRGTEAYFLERQEARADAAAAARAAITSASSCGDVLGEAYGFLQLSDAAVPYIAALAPQEMLAAIGWLERAITLCRSARDVTPREQRFATEVEADCLLKLSTIRIELREYATACNLAEQALALTHASGAQMQEARALSYSAMALENAGRYAEAYARRLTMLNMARTNGSRPQEHTALNNLSCTLIYLGDYRGALEYAQAALRMLGGWTRTPYEDADSYHTLSWAACRAGDVETALNSARQALAFAQATSRPQNQMLPLLALGDALHALQQYGQAQAAYAAALALGREHRMSPLQSAALAGIARCQLALGRDDQAQAAVEEILHGPDILTLGSLWEPLRIAETCFRVLRSSADPRADRLLRAAAMLLDQQANEIADLEQRRMFYEQVLAHHAIRAAVATDIPGALSDTPISQVRAQTVIQAHDSRE